MGADSGFCKIAGVKETILSVLTRRLARAVLALYCLPEGTTAYWILLVFRSGRFEDPVKMELENIKGQERNKKTNENTDYLMLFTSIDQIVEQDSWPQIRCIKDAIDKGRFCCLNQIDPAGATIRKQLKIPDDAKCGD
jgi:hypothetical protein